MHIRNLAKFHITILVLVLSLNTTTSAGMLIPLQHDWESTIHRVLSGYEKHYGPLDNLHITGRFVEFGNYFHNPYKVSASDGRICWNENGYRMKAGIPITRFGQQFALSFTYSDNSTDGRIAKDSSNLVLFDDYSDFSVSIAHRWNEYQIRWGFELQWINLNDYTLFIPTWELSWGEETAVQFSIVFARDVVDSPWSWKIRQDVLSGRVGYISDATKFSTRFGDPYGLGLSVSIDERQIRRLSNLDTDEFFVTQVGENRSLGIYLEELPRTDRLGWKAGGTQSVLKTETSLRQNDSTFYAVSPISEFSQYSIGGSLSYYLLKRLLVSATANYYTCSGNMNGVIAPAGLPDEFFSAIGDWRYYFFDCSVKGLEFNAGLKTHGKGWVFGSTIGYLNVVSDIQITDYDYIDLNDPGRENQMPLKSAGIGWVTMNCELTWKQFTIGGVVSQGILLHHKLYSSMPLGGNAEVSGGLLGEVRFKILF